MVARTLGKRDTEKEEKTYKVKFLYEVFGISKQAYYKRIKTQQTRELQQHAVIKEVEEIRTKCRKQALENSMSICNRLAEIST